MGACLTPYKYAANPPVLSRHSGSNRSNVIMEICQIILTPHAPPFKVTRGHWNRYGSVGCLWLSISDP